MFFRNIALAAAMVLAGSAQAGTAKANADGDLSLLSQAQRTTLSNWLQRHPQYQVAVDSDCDCDEDLRVYRTGSEWSGAAVPDYHPYILVGDFRGNGVADFAVMFRRADKRDAAFLAIFDGPFPNRHAPAYLGYVGTLAHLALFQGETGVTVSAFESEGCAYIPSGKTYREVCDD